MPLALRLGRARRRALNRRALTRRFGAASTALVEGWSGPPEPAVAAGPSLAAPASIEPAPVPPAPLPVATLPRGDVPPADEGEPAGRLRRCTFRRLDPTGPALGRDGTTYTVVCLYGGTAEPESLGDLASAAAACRACTNTGIFRPDEA